MKKIRIISNQDSENFLTNLTRHFFVDDFFEGLTSCKQIKLDSIPNTKGRNNRQLKRLKLEALLTFTSQDYKNMHIFFAIGKPCFETLIDLLEENKQAAKLTSKLHHEAEIICCVETDYLKETKEKTLKIINNYVENTQIFISTDHPKPEKIYTEIIQLVDEKVFEKINAGQLKAIQTININEYI